MVKSYQGCGNFQIGEVSCLLRKHGSARGALTMCLPASPSLYVRDSHQFCSAPGGTAGVPISQMRKMRFRDIVWLA